jgi:hypothetical protein
MGANGETTSLLICTHCYRFVKKSQLSNPFAAMGVLVGGGIADRPPAATYLGHQAWRTLWLGVLAHRDDAPGDENSILLLVIALEEEIIGRVAAGFADVGAETGLTLTDAIEAAFTPDTPPGATTPFSDVPGFRLDQLVQCQWGISRKAFQEVMGDLDELPPHPTENALGFSGKIQGVPADIVGYFETTMFGRGKLRKVTINFFDARPSDAEIAATFEACMAVLTEVFGNSDGDRPGDPMDPPKMRQSRMVHWVTNHSVVLASMALLADGVAPTAPGLGIFYADKHNDPTAQLVVRQAL